MMTNRLIIGLMYKKNQNIQDIISILHKHFGKLLAESDEFDFNFTNFYKKEFGTNLKKRYLVFSEIKLDDLPNIKEYCVELEKDYSRHSKRIFNIDPGYLTKDKLVFASAKPRPHRICLKNQIYADLQLVYENKQWKTFTWTFPDTKKIISFLEKIRQRI